MRFASILYLFFEIQLLLYCIDPNSKNLHHIKTWVAIFLEKIVTKLGHFWKNYHIILLKKGYWIYKQPLIHFLEVKLGELARVELLRWIISKRGRKVTYVLFQIFFDDYFHFFLRKWSGWILKNLKSIRELLRDDSL